MNGVAPAGTVTEAFAWLEAAVCIGTALGSAGAGIAAQHLGPPSAFVLAGIAGAVAVALAASRTIDVADQAAATVVA